MKMIPSAIASLPAIAESLAGKRPALFLDYDGTLAPIAARPQLARLSPAMRGIVSRLGKLCPVAVVSGRDREDVERLVGIDSISYAGSHGFDIRGPGGREMNPGQGEAFVPRLRQAEAETRARPHGIEGAPAEAKKYALPAHWAAVSGAGRRRGREAADGREGGGAGGGKRKRTRWGGRTGSVARRTGPAWRPRWRGWPAATGSCGKKAGKWCTSFFPEWIGTRARR